MTSEHVACPICGGRLLKGDRVHPNCLSKRKADKLKNRTVRLGDEYWSKVQRLAGEARSNCSETIRGLIELAPEETDK